MLCGRFSLLQKGIVKYFNSTATATTSAGILKHAKDDGILEAINASTIKDIPVDRIRNFGIIAHIDHGKSTLADRLLEITGCKMKDSSGTSTNNTPTLDSLPVERERGITVKAQSATMFYRHRKKEEGGCNSQHLYMLNLIDTPGHVDFTNEVARSLSAIQGALLIVDAASGVQAQTVAHYWRAKEYGISTIIPVLNKVDLPQANIDATLEQIHRQLKLDIFNLPLLTISAKTGLNVETVIPAIIDHIPPPKGTIESSFEASLVDCWYEDFRGVICLFAIRNGSIRTGDQVKAASTPERIMTVDQVGILQPSMIQTDCLQAGQIGWIRCGIKRTNDVVVGDTFYDPKMTLPPTRHIPSSSLPKLKPIVFAGMFPITREEHEEVSDAMEKLLLNDSSVHREKVVSTALGPGWKLGFSGSLHMDVFRQRLEQEFNVNIILTTPTVSYEVIYKDNPIPSLITLAEEYPNEKRLANVKLFKEPYVNATIIMPSNLIGSISKLLADSRCVKTEVEYIDEDRAKMIASLPLVEIIGEFNDRLLSISKGYASFDYEVVEGQAVDLVKVAVKLNGELIDVLSTIQPRVRAESVGRSFVGKLAGLLPRQQFAVAIQACISNRVVARETLSALRKDVIAKCYGGDKTRKTKLLEKQKEGKEKMKSFGKVTVPHESFIEIMKIGL